MSTITKSRHYIKTAQRASTSFPVYTTTPTSTRNFSYTAASFSYRNPVAWTETEIDEEARRLLRALLRESSYLPDSKARNWVKHQITSRFERRTKNNKKLFKKSAGQPIIKALIDAAFKKGYKSLRQLQAANNGELVQLDKVLRLAYGRTGPYRRQLLKHLLHADPLDDSALLEKQIQQHQGPKTPKKTEWTIDTVPVDKVFEQPPLLDNDTLVYVISPQYSKFKAIVESQVNVRPSEMRGTVLKRADYVMPSKNTWGRMMPRLRVKNMVHTAYAKLLDKVLPPLNEEEWNRLHGLVHGTVKGEGIRPRRKRIPATPGTRTSYDIENLVRLDSSSDDEDVLEESREKLLQDELSIGPRLDKSAKGKLAGHQITPRLLQRLWQNIFEACSMLIWDEKDGKWKVVWGHGPEPLYKCQPNDELAPLFEALENTNAELKKLRKYPELKPLRKNDVQEVNPNAEPREHRQLLRLKNKKAEAEQKSKLRRSLESKPRQKKDARQPPARPIDDALARTFEKRGRASA